MSFSVQSCCVDSPPEPREISTKLFIHSYYTRAPLSVMVMVMMMVMVMVMVMVMTRMVIMVMVYLNPPLHRGTARCEIGVHMDHT